LGYRFKEFIEPNNWLGWSIVCLLFRDKILVEHHDVIRFLIDQVNVLAVEKDEGNVVIYLRLTTPLRVFIVIDRL
jgi:hypothetical protein